MIKRIQNAFPKLSAVNILVVILAFSVVIVGLGVTEVVQIWRFSQFVQCQADYNQQSSLARAARTDAQKKENQALYDWLETFNPLIKGEKDPDSIGAFKKDYRKMIHKHEHRIRTEAKHPYPPEPDKSCGGSPL